MFFFTSIYHYWSGVPDNDGKIDIDNLIAVESYTDRVQLKDYKHHPTISAKMVA